MDDAFGRALFDFHRGRPGGRAVFRRETGASDAVNVAAYFAPPAEWTLLTREMVERVEGRTIDAGCGAGRAALALQERGHEVLAVDRSPLAVRTAYERGVGSVATMDVGALAARPRSVDTVLAIGQQLPSVASLDPLGERLDTLRAAVTQSGRLIADFADPTHESLADRADELTWLAGDAAIHRFAVEYGDHADPWTTQLVLSPSALDGVATDWEIDEVVRGSDCTYAVVFRPSR